MNRIRRVLLIAIIILPLKFNAQASDGFTIVGHVTGLSNGTNVYLYKMSNNKLLRTAKVENGDFVLKGTVPNGTEYYYLKLDTAVTKKPSRALFLENRKLRLNASVDGWPTVELIGSKSDNEFQELVKLWNEVGNTANAKPKMKVFIEEHLNSVYVPDLIQNMDKQILSYDEKLAYYNQLTPRAQSSYFGKELKKFLGSLKKWQEIKEGSIIPDFVVSSVNGQKQSIRKLVSKNDYTLIDFWASWCRPCRAQIPNLKKVYAAFHEQGFGIVSISQDKKVGDWKKALAEEKTEWSNYIDLRDTASDIFDINAIPFFVLVDRHGKLVALLNLYQTQVESFGPGLLGDDLYGTIQKLVDQNNSTRVDGSSANKKTTEIKPLSVGDKMPDISFDQILNYKTTKAKISDFKGKLLILDFWFTGCVVCVHQFPRLTELQQTLGDKVVILPVGFDVYQKGEISQFVEKRKGTKREMKLPTAIVESVGPFAYDTTFLMQLFPCGKEMPTEIWIDGSGVIIGITDHNAVTQKNIEDILNGKKLNFSVKKKRLLPSELDEFLLKKGKDNEPVYGAAFCGYVDTLSSAEFTPEVDSISIRYFSANNTVFNYYLEAYQQFFKSLNMSGGIKRIFVESENKLFYESDPTAKEIDNWVLDNFEKKNLFGFELKLPASYTMDEFYQRMISELDAFFKIKSGIERKKVKCLALVVSDVGKIVKSNLKKEKSDVDKDFNYVIQGITTDGLIANLGGNDNIPFLIINETDIPYPIDITIPIPSDEKELSVIRPFLNKYGFDLVEVERELDMLVLRNQR